MSNTLKHKFTSAWPEGADPLKVRTSNWNDEHAFAGGSNGDVLAWLSTASDKVQWRNIGVYDVRAFGAVGDGATDCTTAIQAAIDAAKDGGSAGLPGGTVLLPPGEWAISAPLVLPRTTASPTHVVHLVGAGIRCTRLKGLAASFPTGRALIEWDTTAAACYHQKIANMNLLLPNVASVMAINYKPTDKSNLTAALAQTLQIDLHDLLIEGSDQYHQRLIYLEGRVFASSFQRLYSDNGYDTPTYDTILLETDTSDYGTPGDDGQGLSFCHLEKLHSMLRRGGFSVAFKGRLWRSYMVDVHGEQARSLPTMELINPVASTIDNYVNEGGGSAPQLKISHGSSLIFRNLGIGNPYNFGLGVGNGIELVDVRDSVFETMWRKAGNASFYSFGVKYLVLDADCKRNRFSNILINDSLAHEVTNNAPASAGNYGDFYDIASDVHYYLGAPLWSQTEIIDGITAPGALTGRARIYVDTADGDLKVVFGDGTVKTIVVDT
jgi:pectate lyase-like protein